MPRHLVIQVDLLPWLKDSALEDSENLPEPEVLAVEIVEDLHAALVRYRPRWQDHPVAGRE